MIITDHNHDKYITTTEFNALAADVFNSRLAQPNLIAKTDFDAKLWSLNRKLRQVKQRIYLLKMSYFIDKSYFEEDGTQNYLVFQPINKYFKVITNTDYVSSWKSKGLSAETIKPPTISDTCLTPAVSYYGTKTRVKFIGSYFRTAKNFMHSCKSNKHLHCL